MDVKKLSADARLAQMAYRRLCGASPVHTRSIHGFLLKSNANVWETGRACRHISFFDINYFKSNCTEIPYSSKGALDSYAKRASRRFGAQTEDTRDDLLHYSITYTKEKLCAILEISRGEDMLNDERES